MHKIIHDPINLKKPRPVLCASETADMNQKSPSLFGQLLVACLLLATPVALSAEPADEGTARTAAGDRVTRALTSAGVKGDGLHDDTAALQAALDTRSRMVYLPPPPDKYIISKTLVIYSGQTLLLDRTTTIRLADKADAHMLTNSDHAGGNQGITLIGGIWDGNNAHQTPHGKDYQGPYNPTRFLGILIRFNNVQDLRISGLTLKDPETFAVQLGNLRQFTIDDITFDYNLLRLNMDGIHLHGNCHHGRISNLKGTTNDDLLALNADDGGFFEMTRGPITDLEADGLFSENGYTAVRLLSAGSPIQRVRLSNIYGSYRYNVVSFTHHNVHPGAPTVFEDIVIDGVFCSKPVKPLAKPLPSDEWGRTAAPLIWIASGATVRSLHLKNLQRTEHLPKAPDSVVIDPKAVVEYLGMSHASLVNKTNGPISLLTNKGTIQALNMVNIRVKAEGGAPRGYVLNNSGQIHTKHLTNIIDENLTAIEAPR